MSIVQSLADRFRATADLSPVVDQYGVLSPLMATSEKLHATSALYGVFVTGTYGANLQSQTKQPLLPPVKKAGEAYRLYTKALGSHEQIGEKTKIFSTVITALGAMDTNLVQIEDNFKSLLNVEKDVDAAETLKSTSIVIMGYVEQVDRYCTWLSILAEHLSAEPDTMIPPYRTTDMISHADQAGKFATLNLTRWNPHTGGILSEIKEMHRKGSDVAIKANGMWIDAFTHDAQFSPVEQDLMTAGMRSIVLMMIGVVNAGVEAKLAKLTAQKDWLTSKVVYEQAKLQGMDPKSAQGIKLKSVVDYYADMISKHDQKIARLRG